MWNLLFLCLGIAIGSSDKDGRSVSPQELVLPILTIIGALSFATAFMYAVAMPSGDQDCGGLYNPCMPFGKWTMVAILGVPSIGCLIAIVALAWTRAARKVGG
jgi:hypothetical protein